MTQEREAFEAWALNSGNLFNPIAWLAWQARAASQPVASADVVGGIAAAIRQVLFKRYNIEVLEGLECAKAALAAMPAQPSSCEHEFVKIAGGMIDDKTSWLDSVCEKCGEKRFDKFPAQPALSEDAAVEILSKSMADGYIRDKCWKDIAIKAYRAPAGFGSVKNSVASPVEPS